MKKPLKIILYILGGAVGIFLMAKLLLPVGLPFLLGLLLAKLASPLVKTLTEKAGLPYRLAAGLAVTVICAGVFGFLWLLLRGFYSGGQALMLRLPRLLSSLETPLANLEKTLLRLSKRLPDSLSNAAAQWITSLFEDGSMVAEGLSDRMMNLAGTLLGFVPELILFLLTTLISAYLLSAGQPQISTCVKQWLPDNWNQRLGAIFSRLKSALGGYCKTQLMLMAVVFVLLSAGFFLLKQPWALLLALAIAVVDALPVLGVGTVLLPWAAISLLQGNTVLGIGLLALYAVVSVSRTVLEPRFLGKQIGLHPLLTLISLYAGYRLFGLLGMILVPVCVILLRQVYDLVEQTPEKN